MVLKPRSTQVPLEAPEKPHFGFDRKGQVIRSAIIVDNQPTNFARMLCLEVVRKFLSPADTMRLWLRDTEKFGVPSLIATRFWPGRQRFHEWPGLPTETALESYIARWGRADGYWNTDEIAWASLCDKAEDFHGYESRFSMTLRHLPMVQRWMPGLALETAHRELLAACRESDARRGRDDANGLDSYSKLMQSTESTVLPHGVEDADLPMRGEG